MALFGHNDDDLKKLREQLDKERIELDNRRSSLDSETSAARVHAAKLEAQERQLEQERVALDRRKDDHNELIKKLEEARREEAERREDIQRKRAEHEEQMRQLEEQTRRQIEQHKSELDNQHQRVKETMADLQKWSDRLRGQQDEAEAGLAKRRGEMEQSWHEQTAKLEERQRDLERKNVAILVREQAVGQREITAEGDFQEQRAALEKKLHDQRRTALESLEKEIEQERTEQTKRIANERKAWIEDFSREQASIRDLKDKAKQKLEDLAKHEDVLQSGIEGNNAREAELLARTKSVNEQRNQLSNVAQRLAKEQAAGLIAEADAARSVALQQSKRLQEILIERERRIQKLEEEDRRIDGRAPNVILDEIDRLGRELDRVTNERDARPSPERYRELQGQISENENLRDQLSNLQRRSAALQAAADRADMDAVELSRKKEQILQDTRIIEVRDKRIEQLTADLDRLIGDRRDAEADIEKCQRAIRTPITGKIDFKRKDCDPIAPENEKVWLGGIQKKCLDSGFVFSERLLKSFHTALKIHDWSPLTVLAGVSGTGKTQLPNLYARFGGLRFLNQSVQPNWDSPSSLLGYFNAIDNRFNATELLQALDQASRNPGDAEGFNDQLLLVLLDEMNLAHVELYLSDFLSYWELKRGDDTERAISLSLGANIDEPYQLKVGSNVLWCGTMNQDETTKSISDKVIDRGSQLFFPRPSILARREKLTLAEPGQRLSLNGWNSWHVDVGALGDLANGEIGKLRIVVQDINQHLGEAGRALGHRVWQTIEAYITNHPDVTAASQTQDESLMKSCIRTAFGDQVVMKIMPKLRGIETDGRMDSHCLKPIKQILHKEDLGLGDDFDIACRSGHGVFMWSSAQYLTSANEIQQLVQVEQKPVEQTPLEGQDRRPSGGTPREF